ncbi:MAG: type II toxin-antitoxin system PemK/MazF family toxin [Longimicrobiales bacterium]
MAERVSRGEIRLYDFGAPDKRRPVLILTRQDVIPLLGTVMVAPITSSIRGAPSEVVLGVEEGLKKASAVNLDHVQTVDQRKLGRYVGAVSSNTMARVCRALSIATGCGS